MSRTQPAQTTVMAQPTWAWRWSGTRDDALYTWLATDLLTGGDDHLVVRNGAGDVVVVKPGWTLARLVSPDTGPLMVLSEGAAGSLLTPLESEGNRWCCEGNAEDCVLCIDASLPYPFICPGDHADTPRNRKAVLARAAGSGREAVRDAMARLRVYDAIQGLSSSRKAETPICELPHETIEEEEACEALREAAKRARELLVHPDQGEPLDPKAFRALVSQRLLRVAVERTTREWICCEPVNPDHALCVRGNAVVKMLTALLTDDETVFPPSSDFLDEVMRLLQGAADPGYRHHVLSEAEITELYGKAVAAGFQQVVDWDGMDDLKPAKADVIHAITTRVVNARDRELQRNRQRLLVADDVTRRFQETPAVDAAEVRREERLKALNDVHVKIMGEIASPFEEIAFHNVKLWLRRERDKLKPRS